MIASVADEVKVDVGAVLTRQGRLGREFLLILDGTARVESDGKVVARLSAGDFCGGMSLIDGKPRCATVVAESTAIALVIEGRPFRKLLDAVPGLAKRMLVTLCERLRASDESLASSD